MTISTPTINNNLETIINNLKRAANNPALHFNYGIPVSRLSQMITLAFFTGTTLIGQYIMLGLLALGKGLGFLPDWFIWFELTLWGMRAIVEVAVVIYVTMTEAKTEEDENRLKYLERGMIAMIFLTVGPIWWAINTSSTIADTITGPGLAFWAFGIAGISSIMLAAVANAYKIQKHFDFQIIVTEEEQREMLETVSKAEEEAQQALVDVAAMSAERDEAIKKMNEALAAMIGMERMAAVLSFIPKTKQLEMALLFSDELPSPDILELKFQLAGSTIRGAIADYKKSQMLIGDGVE